jgi:Primase C terminal 1 (PriCT-1)
MSITSRLHHLPHELIERAQWVLWKREERDGKNTKVPYQCTGYRASVTNRDHWSRFDHAIAMAERPGFCDGIGFVFTVSDPFCGIDLDNCYPSECSDGVAWASGILERFSDTYSEESPSGRGVKIWCMAKAQRCGKWQIENGAIEVYDHGRFFTITGRAGESIPRVLSDHQADVELLIANLDGSAKRSSLTLAVSGKIPEGQRHNTLVSLAGAMWRRGMCAEAIEAALNEVNQRQCDPPRTPQHIRQIVESMRGWSR